MLGGAILTLIVLYKLIYSNIGLNFRAVQNDERAAASLGVDVVRMRVLAFTVSSALAGMAGGLYGHYLLLITPEIPSLDQQFLVLSMTVIGGMGSFRGTDCRGLFPGNLWRNTFAAMVNTTSWSSAWWPWWWRALPPTASWGLPRPICRAAQTGQGRFGGGGLKNAVNRSNTGTKGWKGRRCTCGSGDSSAWLRPRV